jgi:hypothetical protein
VIDREELRDAFLAFVMPNLEGPRLKYSDSSRSLTAHVPEKVVFTPKSDVIQQLANAEKWVETTVQAVIPQAKIKKPLSKRASRRHRGRSKRYLN